MKQCPTCGHRTNDDHCPVCGAATVVLKTDPQEKAQRTIQYQRFDPSKTPGTAAGARPVPAKSPTPAARQTRLAFMQRGCFRASSSRKFICPGKPGDPKPGHPSKSGSSCKASGSSSAGSSGKSSSACSASCSGITGNSTPQQAAPNPARPAAPQQSNGEYRPSTLPRRSQKYRQKYAAYADKETAPANQSSPTQQAAPARPASPENPTAPVQSAPAVQQNPAAPAQQSIPPQPAVPATMQPQQEEDDFPAEFDELLMTDVNTAS